MKLFSLLSSFVAVHGVTFRSESTAGNNYLSTNKDIAAHTQWKPSQVSERNGVGFIFELEFGSRDDGSFCSNGYTGNTCTERVCAYGLSSSTSAFLTSGDSVHTPTSTAGWDIESWGGGSDYGGTHSYTECSSQGVCDRLTGECACFAGYQGKGCRRTVCPNDCSGHGRCSSNQQINPQYVGHRAGDEVSTSFSTQFWDFDKTMQCSCDRGFAGNDCSERICPHGDDVLTSCSDSNTVDVQSIKLSNVVTAQSYLSPFLQCGEVYENGGALSGNDGTMAVATNGLAGDQALTPNDFSTALELAVKNDAYIGDSHSPAVFAPHFSLSFVDHFGGEYSTSPIQVQSMITTAQVCMQFNADGTPTSGQIEAFYTKADCLDVVSGDFRWVGADPTVEKPKVATATALAVQQALQNLPNHAVPSVQVIGVTTATRNVELGRDHMDATVDANNNLEWQGFHDVFAGMPCIVKDITLEVHFVDDANSGKQNTLVAVNPDAATDCAAGMQPYMPPTTFNELTTDPVKQFMAEIYDEDEEIDVGTHEENAECGNRGICDTSTGKCSCFSGHTGEACGIQSNFV